MSADVVLSLPAQQPAGFTQSQFRKLDQAYCLAAAKKILTYRSVECDFDDGIASYTYYMAENAPPFLQFVIRKVGPKTTMFELYKQGKGRILKSGLFERSYDALREEIETLLNGAQD
jgi:hypothetical protein